MTPVTSTILLVVLCLAECLSLNAQLTSTPSAILEGKLAHVEDLVRSCQSDWTCYSIVEIF